MSIKWTDIWYGVDASKPAFGIAGRLACATDTKIIYRDTGTAWEEVARGETAVRLAQLAEKSHVSLTGVTADQHHAKVHGITEHDASAKSIRDNAESAAQHVCTVGTWTDLLTINRTLNEARNTTILAGFRLNAGAGAGRMEMQIQVNGGEANESFRHVSFSADEKGFLETHAMCVLAASTAYTIKLLYWVSTACDIYDRALSILYVE